MPRFISGLALIAVFAIAGCRAAPMYSPSDISFSVPPTAVQKVLTLEDYKNAIIRGGSKRGKYKPGKNKKGQGKRDMTRLSVRKDQKERQ